jgi:hypothetical protein
MSRFVFCLALGLPFVSFAQQPVRCETTPFGVTKCSDGQVGVQQGSGQTVWNNNVVGTPQPYGNQTTFSNGTSAVQNGNQTTYSNGKTCTNNNGLISCR